eukprot:1213428-Karenia_brevis.AAC.1
MMRMTAEANSFENEMNRVGGFSPAQWIIGRQPRRGAETSDDETNGSPNSLEERVDPTTISAARIALRQEAQK